MWFFVFSMWCVFLHLYLYFQCDPCPNCESEPLNGLLGLQLLRPEIFSTVELVSSGFKTVASLICGKNMSLQLYPFHPLWSMTEDLKVFVLCLIQLGYWQFGKEKIMEHRKWPMPSICSGRSEKVAVLWLIQLIYGQLIIPCTSRFLFYHSRSY